MYQGSDCLGKSPGKFTYGENGAVMQYTSGASSQSIVYLTCNESEVSDFTVIKSNWLYSFRLTSKYACKVIIPGTPTTPEPSPTTPAKTSPTKPATTKPSPTTPAKTSPTKPATPKTSPTKPAKTSPTKPATPKTSPTKPAKTSPTKP